MDQFETQVRIMQQSNAMQESIQDLYRWEKEMKQKENLSHQTAVASEVSVAMQSAKNEYLAEIFLERFSLFPHFFSFARRLTANFQSEAKRHQLR